MSDELQKRVMEAQELGREGVPEGTSITDEPMQERREEVAREAAKDSVEAWLKRALKSLNDIESGKIPPPKVW
jgi:hypothetical protein